MEECNVEDLYRLHRQRLLGLILSKVEDSQKAEDLLHDSFIKLETCCANGCKCEKPKSYLFKTALNIVFDYIKRRKKKPLQLTDDMANQRSESSLKKSTETCDILSCISNFLEETSDENRQAFEQADLFQIPQVQIAKDLGIPLPTLKARVQRTRKYLSERLTTCCPDHHEKCL